jgi:uncharacterized protein (DUF849 family)
MLRDAVLIEAAINEGVLRAEHPHVPVSAEECAVDAIAAVRAGASFAHWHARDERTGEQRTADTDAYARAWRAMRAAGIVAYPTYPSEPAGDVKARLAHCFALVAEHGLEMVPLDLGTVPQVFWDGARLRGGGTLANPLAFLEEGARRYRELGAIVNLASFDPGSTRLAVHLAQTGVLEPPLLLKLYLSDSWLVGPGPSEAALDLHLAQLPPDLEVDWLVVPFQLRSASTFERLCRHALARGGGFRVGIGDNPGLFPRQTNAQLVERVLPWVEASGRPLATSDDVRRRHRGRG